MRGMVVAPHRTGAALIPPLAEDRVVPAPLAHPATRAHSNCRARGSARVLLDATDGDGGSFVVGTRSGLHGGGAAASARQEFVWSVFVLGGGCLEVVTCGDCCRDGIEREG